MAKERGDGKPVREPAHHAGLRDREHEPAPPRLAQWIGGDGKHDGGHQNRERETPLAAHGQRGGESSRKSSMRSVARGPAGYVCVPRASPPLHAWPMSRMSHVSATGIPRRSRCTEVTAPSRDSVADETMPMA